MDFMLEQTKISTDLASELKELKLLSKGNNSINRKVDLLTEQVAKLSGDNSEFFSAQSSKIQNEFTVQSNNFQSVLGKLKLLLQAINKPENEMILYSSRDEKSLSKTIDLSPRKNTSNNINNTLDWRRLSLPSVDENNLSISEETR